MGDWKEILEEVQSEEKKITSPFDSVRRKYIKNLHTITGRNTVVYYSGWLQKPAADAQQAGQIEDIDKNGFMSCFKGMDFEKGLDLIIHSPGGNVAATESIIHYCRSLFKDNIRTIIPQISMSGGTMLALMGKEIVMGKHSNLGPIDPHLFGIPTKLVEEEFKKATEEIVADPKRKFVWEPILSKYSPTFLSQCKNAIKWSEEIGKAALKEGMLKGNSNADAEADKIVKALSSTIDHKAHDRHIHREAVEEMGINVFKLESEPELQDAVLSIHHAIMITFDNTTAIKIIENHDDGSYIRMLRS